MVLIQLCLNWQTRFNIWSQNNSLTSKRDIIIQTPHPLLWVCLAFVLSIAHKTKQKILKTLSSLHDFIRFSLLIYMQICVCVHVYEMKSKAYTHTLEYMKAHTWHFHLRMRLKNTQMHSVDPSIVQTYIEYLLVYKCCFCCCCCCYFWNHGLLEITASWRPALPEGFPLEKFLHPKCQPGLSAAARLLLTDNFCPSKNIPHTLSMDTKP